MNNHCHVCAGLDIGYVPAAPDAFFRWSGQFGPQQFILWWPAGPVAFDGFFIYFFYNFAQCCKCMLTEPHAPKMHVYTPSTANAFSGHNIEDLLIPHPVPPCDGLTYGICPRRVI